MGVWGSECAGFKCPVMAAHLEGALVGLRGELVPLRGGRVEAEVDRDVRQRRRRRPDAGQRQCCPPASHAPVVVERVGDGDVAVPADATEVQQRCGREEHVVGIEHVARQRPEQPLTRYHLYRVAQNKPDYSTFQPSFRKFA